MEYASFEKVSENLLLVKFDAFRPTNEGFEEYLAKLKENIEQFSDLAIVVFDTNNLKHMSSELRHRQAEWMKENEVLITNKCLLSIYVINNPIIRFLLEAIFLVQKSPIPYQVVRSFSNAQEIANDFFDVTSVNVEGVK